MSCGVFYMKCAKSLLAVSLHDGEKLSSLVPLVIRTPILPDHDSLLMVSLNLNYLPNPSIPKYDLTKGYNWTYELGQWWHYSVHSKELLILASLSCPGTQELKQAQELRSWGSVGELARRHHSATVRFQICLLLGILHMPHWMIDAWQTLKECVRCAPLVPSLQRSPFPWAATTYQSNCEGNPLESPDHR